MRGLGAQATCGAPLERRPRPPTCASRSASSLWLCASSIPCCCICPRTAVSSVLSQYDCFEKVEAYFVDAQEKPSIFWWVEAMAARTGG